MGIDFINSVFIIGWLSSSIRLMTPLLYASLGGIFASRSGVINIALEGCMIVGAFAGVFGAYAFNNPWIGVLFGLVFGALVSMILAFLSISVGANQVVSGTVINLLALGMTSFLSSIVFGQVPPSKVAKLRIFPVPILSEIPIIGEIFFHNSILTYLSIILVPIIWWILFKTPIGLTIRSVGESPETADSLGINVSAVRYICILISGGLAGVGGAFLSLDLLSVFMENMTAGRGFIALAALVLGKWHPVGALGASFLFAAADAFQFRLQTYGLNFPVELLQMFPYVAAMIALVGFVGKSTPPAAIGKPYTKE